MEVFQLPSGGATVDIKSWAWPWTWLACTFSGPATSQALALVLPCDIWLGGTSTFTFPLGSAFVLASQFSSAARFLRKLLTTIFYP